MEVQPESPVLVKISVPEEFKNSEKFYVYHIDENGDVETIEDVTVEDGYIIFLANSFSVIWFQVTFTIILITIICGVTEQ